MLFTPVKIALSGDSPEVRQRSFAALRMTAWGCVILSAAKDLCGSLARPFATLRVTDRISKYLYKPKKRKQRKRKAEVSGSDNSSTCNYT